MIRNNLINITKLTSLELYLGKNQIGNNGISEIGNSLSNLSLLNYLNLDLNEIGINNTGFGIVLENLELLND